MCGLCLVAHLHVRHILRFTGASRWPSSFSTHSFHQRFYCGPNKDEMMWTDAVMPYISIVIMFLTVVHGSIGTAQPENCQDLKFPDCPITSQPQQFKVDDTGGQKLVRNEKNGLSYSYPLFHIMLALATLFMMMSLTGWYTPQKANLVTFGRSWPAVWIKMVSSWVCLLIYTFTMLFPSLVPERYQPLLRLTPAQTLSRAPSRVSCYSYSQTNGRNDGSHYISRSMFGSSTSIGVTERLRRYSQGSLFASEHSSVDAVPLTLSERSPTIVCHQETTV